MVCNKSKVEVEKKHQQLTTRTSWWLNHPIVMEGNFHLPFEAVPFFCLFPPALRWRNLSLEIDPSPVGIFFENIRGFEKKLGGLSGEFTTPSTARTTSARPGRVEIGPPAPSPQKSPQKPGGNQCLIRPYFWRVGLPLGGEVLCCVESSVNLWGCVLLLN